MVKERNRRRIEGEHDDIDAPPAAKIKRTNSKVQALSVPTIGKNIGNVLSCGQNEVGQLGLGDNVQEKTRPAILDSAKNVVDINAGGIHSLYLNNDGEVYSFGCNDEGALGRDTSEEGSEYFLMKVQLPSKAVKISAGDSHSAALLEDGRAFAWGSFRDSHGNMGFTMEGNKRFPIEVVCGVKFVDIVSGADHLILLTNHGKVYSMGCAEQGQLGRITERSASGESRRGKSELLQPGVVHFKSNIFIDAIWASTYCTFAREKYTNNIYAFGLNNYHQLGVKKTSESVFAPKLTKFTKVKSIAGGQHHTLILTNDNKCQVIGRKDYGRLGIGKVENDLEETQPVKALDDKHVVSISCGESCSFAVTNDGKVYAWGMGSNQQLGIGSEDDQYEPVLLTGQQVKDKHVVAVNGGGLHTLFIVADTKLTNGNTENSTKGGNKKK